MKISIIIPVYNEEDNILPLYKELNHLGRILPSSTIEFIFVDDGSIDSTVDQLKNIKNKDKRIKIIQFTRNFGQTAAFDCGIKASNGELVVTTDGDLQNDISDIKKLIKKIGQGYDVVCGWRKNRKDKLSKKIFSLGANFLRKKLTGELIHDSGCSLRVYRREVFSDVDLYGEMHRFIPAILTLKGYNITEIVINHRPRLHGKSKYGLLRLLKGLLDLLFIVFLFRFVARPLHIFGALGVFTSFVGFLLAFYLTILKIFSGAALANRPLLILAVLLIVLGTQFLIFGILAEILIRIYFKTHAMRPYSIRKII